MNDPRPLIAHVLFRFGVGGLENGVVNLINRMDANRWRHAVVALDAVADEMRQRVQRRDVSYLSLDKPPGHLLPHYPRVARLFRQLAPSIVHTRNLGPLEAAVPAWLAGVPVRVHGEHGWDVNDVEGSNRRNRLLRRLYRPFVHRYVALSGQIEGYLRDAVGVPAAKISTICNGVDVVRFQPAGTARPAPAGMPPGFGDGWVVGCVGRLQAVKDQLTLVRAFARAAQGDGDTARRLRLLVVGDGPARAEIEAAVAELGLGGRVWLAGERSDIPALMRCFDLFCLPSLSEGISNTVLEAMATGLPVVATRVGGNAELVDDHVTGRLFMPRAVESLADLLLGYAADPALARRQGAAARTRVERRFSLKAMVRAYDALYVEQLQLRGLADQRLRQA